MKKYVLLLGTAAVLFSACQKPNNAVAPVATQQGQDETLLKKLKSIGFSDQQIVEFGDYYLVDGDLLFRKFKTDMDFMDKYFKQASQEPGEKTTIQARSINIVSSINIERLRILPPSAGSSVGAWEPAVREAMTHWAGISNCKINYDYNGVINNTQFTQVNVVPGVLPVNVIAASEFPSSDNPGFQITINTQYMYAGTSSYSNKVYNMVHEMGHCMGFWHPNQEIAGQSLHIPGTPNSDPGSVMNGGTALNTWAGFSANDLLAARTVYPLGTYDRWITSPEGKYPSTPAYFLADNEDPITITWNAGLVSTSTVKLELYQYGILKRVLTASTANSGSYSGKIAYDSSRPGSEQLLGQHVFAGIQVKIISNASTSITDMSAPFMITAD